jgi:hypothetical protein
MFMKKNTRLLAFFVSAAFFSVLAGTVSRYAAQSPPKAKEFSKSSDELEHRLMDYNNLATTRFEDIKSVLQVATRRVSERLASQKSQK